MLRDRDGGADIARGAGLITYEHDWFSGSQIQVMMGDVLIDNAVAITYDVSSPKIPVYGFGSEYYRFTAQGPLAISGSLAITFKEAAYLLYPARRYHNFVKNSRSTSPRYAPSKLGPTNLWYSDDLEALRAAAKQGRVIHQNVEQALSNELAEADGRKRARSGLIKQLSALEDADFENYAEKFEDVIWYGSDPTNATTRESLFSKRMDKWHDEITKDDVFEHRRLDQYPPVDIWITYGDMEAPDGVNHTVEKLLDVEFSRQTKTIQISEEPVVEIYQFIARNKV